MEMGACVARSHYPHETSVHIRGVDFVTGFSLLATPEICSTLIDPGAPGGITNTEATVPIPPRLYGFLAPGPMESLSTTVQTTLSWELLRLTLHPPLDRGPSQDNCPKPEEN
jgi:hypothetical protein